MKGAIFVPRGGCYSFFRADESAVNLHETRVLICFPRAGCYFSSARTK